MTYAYFASAGKIAPRPKSKKSNNSEEPGDEDAGDEGPGDDDDGEEG